MLVLRILREAFMTLQGWLRQRDTPLGRHAAEYGEFEADLATVRKPQATVPPARKR